MCRLNVIEKFYALFYEPVYRIELCNWQHSIKVSPSWVWLLVQYKAVSFYQSASDIDNVIFFNAGEIIAYRI